jgi:anti-sigma factor RsiW
MSCPQTIDWKAYALNELDGIAKREAAAHLSSCEACREELASVQLTLSALSTLRDEEIPRRIAFVSDKVFEPRWWQRMFNPTFASACVLAGAIVFHAYSDRGPSEAEIQAKIDKTVAEQVEVQTVQYEQLLKRIEPVIKSNMQLVNY